MKVYLIVSILSLSIFNAALSQHTHPCQNFTYETAFQLFKTDKQDFEKMEEREKNSSQTFAMLEALRKTANVRSVNDIDLENLKQNERTLEVLMAIECMFALQNARNDNAFDSIEKQHFEQEIDQIKQAFKEVAQE